MFLNSLILTSAPPRESPSKRSISPLWSSTIFLHIASPSPVPLSLCVIYGSKSFSLFLGKQYPLSYISTKKKFDFFETVM